VAARGRISKLPVKRSAGILPASGGGFHPQTHRLEVDATRNAGKMPALRSGRCDAAHHRQPADAPAARDAGWRQVGLRTQAAAGVADSGAGARQARLPFADWAPFSPASGGTNPPL